MKLSIIIPAYNEGNRIGITLEKYGEFFKEKVISKELKGFEMVIVLNACKDNTLEVVKKWQKKYKSIKILNFKRGGKGFALTEGFKDALTRKNDLIGFVDADMATSPEAYYDLVKNIGQRGGIIASRWLKKSKAERSFKKYVRSKGFNFLVRSMLLVNQRDTQCGAKLFKRDVLEKIVPLFIITEWAFDINLLFLCKQNKFKIREFPTVWVDKEESKINFARTPLQMLLGAMRLRIIYSPFSFVIRIYDKFPRWLKIKIK